MINPSDTESDTKTVSTTQYRKFSNIANIYTAMQTRAHNYLIYYVVLCDNTFDIGLLLLD